jgi:hypothetical protein
VPLTGLAAQRATVAGTVVDERGVAVAGAEVRDTLGGRVTTAAAGTFAGLAAGPIRVRRLGFAPLDTALPAGRTHRLVLRPSATTLARLVVHPGHAGDAPGGSAPTVSATRRELELRPQPGEDLLRTLARLPGVAATELSARLRVRGGAADELLYQFDGAELPDPFHLPDLDAALSALDLRAVGGLDLHAGTLPLDLGQRSAGALVFTLPPFDAAPSRTSASLSLTGARVSQHLRLAPRADADLIVRRGYLDLVLDALGESQGLTPRYSDGYGRVRWVGARDRVAGHLLASRDALGFARSGDTRSDARHGTTVGWVTTEHDRGPWHLTTTTALTHRASRRQVEEPATERTPDRFTDARRTLAATLRADLHRSLGARHVLRAGGEWRAAGHAFSVWRVRDTLAVVRNALRRGADTIRLDETPGTRRHALWVGVRSALPRGLVQELGARLDAASWTRETLLAPRAAWRVPLPRGVTLRAGVGLTTQAPLLEERALADGDTARHPATRAVQRALALDGTVHGVRWRADVYWRTTTHERPLWANARSGAIIAPELFDDRVRLDASRGDSRGLELSLRDDATGPWHWAVSWTAARACVHTAEGTRGRCVPRPWDRRHTLAADVGRAVGPWQVAAAWVFHTGDPTSTSVVQRTPYSGGVLATTVFPRPFDRRLPAYHRLDLRVARTFARAPVSGRVFVDLLNVYDRANVRRMAARATRTAGGAERVATRQETGLPFLPSLGVSLDWP